MSNKAQIKNHEFKSDYIHLNVVFCLVFVF